MHDIWNPWHGRHKISEGCVHCYVYYQDGQRCEDGSCIERCLPSDWGQGWANVMFNVTAENQRRAGENYDSARMCRYEWVRGLYEECVATDVRFAFIETGNAFEKDGRIYHFSDKQEQRRQAWRSGLRQEGRPIEWDLRYRIGMPVPPEELYVPRYRCDRCAECGSRMICNGCGNCGRDVERLVAEFEQGLGHEDVEA